MQALFQQHASEEKISMCYVTTEVAKKVFECILLLNWLPKLGFLRVLASCEPWVWAMATVPHSTSYGHFTRLPLDLGFSG